MSTLKTEYHVIKDVSLWLRLKPQRTDIMHLQIGDCPQFIFDVKVCFKDDLSQCYILAHAIPMLHRIRDYILVNNIDYKPKGIIKFVFNLQESTENLPSKMIKYRIPATKVIAQQVCEHLFRYDDQLEATFDDDLIVYYYLSVLVAIDHPVFNTVVQRLMSGLSEEIFCLCTDIPTIASNKTTNPVDLIAQTQTTSDIGVVHLYAEILYFLSLVIEPEDGNTLKQQVQRHTVNLCHKLGVKSPNEMVQRGSAWKLLHHFFESKPVFRIAIVESVIDPPTAERPMNFGECLILNELKRLWQWHRLQDFHDCYVFATNRYTKAHLMPAIVKESQAVINLYQKLWEKVQNDRFIAYSGFYESDEFLEAFKMEKYPSLLYAAKTYTKDESEVKKKKWTKLVASLPLDFHRLEIDMQLDTSIIPEADDPLTRGYFVIVR